jgi:hypothetical protein
MEGWVEVGVGGGSGPLCFRMRLTVSLTLLMSLLSSFYGGRLNIPRIILFLNLGGD